VIRLNPLSIAAAMALAIAVATSPEEGPAPLIHSGPSYRGDRRSKSSGGHKANARKQKKRNRK